MLRFLWLIIREIALVFAEIILFFVGLAFGVFRFCVLTFICFLAIDGLFGIFFDESD